MARIVELKETKDIFHIPLIYIANVLKVVGYGFEVNQCVFCGSKKNIQAFSFDDGGFVCGDCLNEMEGLERTLSVSQMQLIRIAFKANTYKIDEKYLNADHEKFVLIKFKEFIRDALGINLSSLSLISD
mgnify:CR=1 FL=1